MSNLSIKNSTLSTPTASIPLLLARNKDPENQLPTQLGTMGTREVAKYFGAIAGGIVGNAAFIGLAIDNDSIFAGERGAAVGMALGTGLFLGGAAAGFALVSAVIVVAKTVESYCNFNNNEQNTRHQKEYQD